MADETLKRDANRVTVLGAITNDVAQEVRMLRIDPATGRLIVSAVIAGTNNGQLKISAADTTYGYLEDKLVAGSNITLTVLNVGGNEQIQIDATGGGGGGTVGISQFAYGNDVDGTLTSDADHTLLADGTLYLGSTFGDMTGRFIQRLEPSLNDVGIWGMNSLNNSTDAEINILMVDGTNSTDLGNDSALLTVAMFPSTDVQYQQYIANEGTFLGVNGTAWNYYHGITGTGYEVLYDDGVTGGSLRLSTSGAALIGVNPAADTSGYGIIGQFSSVIAADDGLSNRVSTGLDIVDYVQDGTTFSSTTGLGDASVSGDYVGTLTGSYTIDVIGNNGCRVNYSGMTVGTQFDVGEVVTGSISGTTATVRTADDSRFWGYDATGLFVVGDILTGSNGNVSEPAAGISPNLPNDLIEVTFTDGVQTDYQWLLAAMATITPFVLAGGVDLSITSSSGHTPSDTWSFTVTPNYVEKRRVDIDGNTFLNNKNGTTTHSQDIPITEKITLSPAQVNDMNSNPVASTIAVPTGYAVQILEIYGRNTYNTTPYATNTTINIAFASAPTQSLWQQAVLLTETATTIRRFVKTSGSGADVVIPNDSLVITNTSGNPTAGDSDIDVYITYKLIEL